MSDLSAAADALGVPESIVQRSAAARAAETGMTVDEVLAAWAGGGAAPVSAPTPAPAAEPAIAAPEEEPAGEPEAPTAPAPPAVPSVPASVAAATIIAAAPSGKPPVLVGKEDHPLAVLVGAVGLFVAVFLVGLVGPALPFDEPGARSSDLPYSELALEGQDVYLTAGCGSCHTQMVRPIVADVGLGGVTLNDSNQVLGTRRFGPDLSDVGSRLSGSQIETIVAGVGGHPALSLSSTDLEALVAYLVESKTAVPGEGPGEDSGAGTEEGAGTTG
jgi:hypothetical protein